MAFQLKDYISIVASMINYAKATQTKLTDFRIGSVSRTLMESPAVEIEALYQSMFAGILEAIPTAIYRGFDFEMVLSTKAWGVVTVSFGTPVVDAFTIPAGSVFSATATGVTYQSVASVDVAVGDSSVSLVVECTQTGSVGNAAAGLIDAALGVSLPNNSTITSAEITSGQDEETEEERKTRFAAFVQTLARGTNGAIEFAARMAQVTDIAGNVSEYVSRVGFIEVPGSMDVYIYGANQTASDALVAEAQKIIDGYYDEVTDTHVPGYSPVGIRVTVWKMVEQAVDMTITAEMFYGAELSADVQSDIVARVASVISSVQSGDILYEESIVEACLTATSVKSIRTSLYENILCPENTVLVIGDVQLVDGGA